MASTFAIHTLGCKANTYDSHLIGRELRRRGFRPALPGDPPDLLIVNTCTVTDEADRRSRKMAARLHRRNPAARVVVTGCAAEVRPERMARAPGVDYVVGNQDKPRLVELILSALGREREPAPARHGRVLGGVEAYADMRARHPMDRSWPLPEAAFLAPEVEEARTRIFLKIQEGCDAFCTFCVIPYARGPARSLGPAALVAQVRALCAQGAREVVLTGTALGDYGRDLDEASGRATDLETLVSSLLRETSIERLRLSSLDPREVTPGILRLLGEEPRLCPHVHLSLQSPDPVILRRMKRRYGAERAAATLRALDETGSRVVTARGLPGGLFVGMDVIAGFPGETEEVFDGSLARLEALPWHRLHVFRYSEREGTAATRLGGKVPPAGRRRRARALLALSNERLEARYREVLEAGEPLEILLEGPVRGPEGRPLPAGCHGWVSGTTRNYYRVLLPCPDPAALSNQTLRARVEALSLDPRAGDAALIGRPAAALATARSVR